MHQTQFSQKIPYGGFSQIRSHIRLAYIHTYIISLKMLAELPVDIILEGLPPATCGDRYMCAVEGTTGRGG